MADSHTAAKALLMAAGRDATVASAAGIATSPWSSRVLAGNKEGYVAGLHRGRLPAIELFQTSDTWTQASAGDGGHGTVSASWTVRVHSAIFNQDLAEEQCRSILYAMLVKARENAYFSIGEDAVQTFQESPLGYHIECQMTVITTMTRETYETTPASSGGTIPDGGVVGGISRTINWNETSPISILALPAGQAIALVQLKVVTAFDGVTPTVSVGVDGDNGRFLATDESDLTDNNTVWERDADDAGPGTIKVYLNLTGATVGQIKVQILTTAST
jgi:hypothetical protein